MTAEQKNVWPKYRLICGEVERLRHPASTPERLQGKQWLPIDLR